MVVKLKNNLNLKDFKLGFDPEFLLLDTNLNRHVSGLTYNFGDKSNGREICPDCTVENDMVTLEIVLPPVNIEDGLDKCWENFSTVKDLLQKELPENIVIDCCSYAEFTKEELAPEKASTGGCSIDFNAWNNGEPNKSPKFKTPYRSSGAHIHFGMPTLTYKQMVQIVKLTDLFITLPLIFNQSNIERRKLYGAAGAFRCVEGRVEARSPSNCYWSSKEGLEWVFNQAKIILGLVDTEIMETVEYYKEKIIEAINFDNLELATELMEIFNIKYAPLPVLETT